MLELTLRELRHNKVILEQKLREVLGKEMEKFHEATGFSVEDITVHMVDVTTHGDMRPHKILGRINVHLEPI